MKNIFSSFLLVAAAVVAMHIPASAQGKSPAKVETVNGIQRLVQDGMFVEGPIWRPSALVINGRGILNAFKYSGIYRIKLYSYKD